MRTRNQNFKCGQEHPTQKKGEIVSGVYALVYGNKAYVGSSSNIGRRISLHISRFNINSIRDKASKKLISEAGGVSNVELFYDELPGATEEQLCQAEKEMGSMLSVYYFLANAVEPGTNLAPQLQPKPIQATHILTEDILVFASAHAAGHEGFSSQAIWACCNGYKKTHKSHEWKYI